MAVDLADEEGAADEGAAAGTETEGETPAVTLDGESVAVDVPDDATAAEAAAITAAIGAHLNDRRRAAAAAAARDDGPERVDRWKLVGRLRGVGKRRAPRDVRRGEEWRAAARSF
ncbi:hypothetical protein [Halomicrobium salinisoli]|uniref:hypothetical protein n=1 Tax=Halomicrobium salinisoli TaxID=2878391 RepID=UPI001CEFE2BC|nr:hypothetical protein [Halomicrobium salinisoli]